MAYPRWWMENIHDMDKGKLQDVKEKKRREKRRKEIISSTKNTITGTISG